MIKHTFEIAVTIADDGAVEFSVLDSDVPLDQMVECVAAYSLLIQRLNPQSPLAPVKEKTPLSRLRRTSNDCD